MNLMVGRNVPTATTPNTTHSTSAQTCVILTTASSPVGAIACSTRIFINDCTISTSTLKNCATTAVTTYTARQPPSSFFEYSANNAIASTSSEIPPITNPGVTFVIGKKNPVTLVRIVVVKNAAFNPPTVFPPIIWKNARREIGRAHV